MDSIVMRKYQKGDERGIIDLYNQVFDPSCNRDLIKWKWEFLDNPQGPSKIYIYEYNGKIIGHFALIPVLLKYKDETVLSGKAENGMMHFLYRGYGNRFVNLVKKNLESSHEKGMDIFWGFSGPQIIKPQIAAGFNHIADISKLIKVIDIRPCLEAFMPLYIKNKFIYKITIHLISHLFTLFNLFFMRRTKLPRDISIRNISRFDNRVDILWEKVKKDYGITIIRSSEYLNWRFVENPNVKNKIFVAERKNNILGYIVLGSYKPKEYNFKIGAIIDLFLDKKEKKALMGLLDEAIQYFENEGVVCVSFLIVKDGYDYKSFSKLLKKKGFLFKSNKFVLNFLLNANNIYAEKDYPHDIKNWYITYAFGEGVVF